MIQYTPIHMTCWLNDGTCQWVEWVRSPSRSRFSRSSRRRSVEIETSSKGPWTPTRYTIITSVTWILGPQGPSPVTVSQLLYFTLPFIIHNTHVLTVWHTYEYRQYKFFFFLNNQINSISIYVGVCVCVYWLDNGSWYVWFE